MSLDANGKNTSFVAFYNEDEKKWEIQESASKTSTKKTTKSSTAKKSTTKKTAGKKAAKQIVG